MTKLIYANLYPNKHTLLYKTVKSEASCAFSDDMPDDSSEKFFNEMGYIPIPERMVESKQFIDLAKCYSAKTETAIEITQGDDRILVKLFFDYLANSGEDKKILTELIQASDSIDICRPTDNDREIITLLLEFQTHEHFISGIKKI